MLGIKRNPKDTPRRRGSDGFNTDFSETRKQQVLLEGFYESVPEMMFVFLRDNRGGRKMQIIVHMVIRYASNDNVNCQNKHLEHI